MKKRILSLAVAGALCLSLAGCSTSAATSSEDNTGGSSVQSASSAQTLALSDTSITLNGNEVTVESEGAVTVSHDIVYYEAGRGTDYGEGSAEDAHSADEADAHTVVTIRQAGTYHVSGALSAGQLAVDLGEDAKRDPTAVVTLILDGVDITCTVAPALIFYNVYECDTAWVAYDEEETTDFQAAAEVDTSAAGANVILADGSVNQISGSYVARIYKEGATKKLHKYDGAFYSKMSMNISGEAEGTGVLNIEAENEGLGSELHLTINGGVVNIRAQDDGINTNEDGVSVTTVNGGTLTVNAGLGAEGDGIDSNGYLVINGGSVYTVANDRSPDGGIDADGDILINGGYVVAAGTRNDSVSQSAQQLYMELSFASTVAAGRQIAIADGQGNTLLDFTTDKTCQSLTFSSPDLTQDTPYTVTVNGVVQQYTGNSSGGSGGRGGQGGGLQPMDGQEPPEIPEGQDAPQMPDGQKPPALSDGQERPGRGDGQTPDEPAQDGQRPERPQSQTPDGQTGDAAGTGSTEFTLTGATRSFSGVSDSAGDSGKTRVTFSVNNGQGLQVADGAVSVTDVTASEDVDAGHIQITITDVPSENFAATCLLSEGLDALADILPTDPGAYRMTVAVTGDDGYAGTSQFNFTIPET